MGLLLSYTASTISTILGLFEPFSKKMKTVLVINFLGNVLVGSSYLFIGRYSGAAICGTAAVQLLINYTFTAKGKKVPLPWVIVHAAVFLAVNLITFSAWYDILALAAAMLFVISVAQTKTNHYRLIYISNSTLWIIYDSLAGAYGNLSTHIILFLATAAAIFFRDIRTKKQKKCDSGSADGKNISEWRL